jgi:peptidoglycan/LPS O-acetylase OafA/YrhL
MMTLIAAGVGAALWLMLAAFGGRVEAWDSPLYFPVGMPLAILLAGMLGMMWPRRAWRWGGWLMGGQAAALLLSAGPGSLLPLGAILFAVLALPCMLAAAVGGWLRRRLA